MEGPLPTKSERRSKRLSLVLLGTPSWHRSSHLIHLQSHIQWLSLQWLMVCTFLICFMCDLSFIRDQAFTVGFLHRSHEDHHYTRQSDMELVNHSDHQSPPIDRQCSNIISLELFTFHRFQRHVITYENTTVARSQNKICDTKEVCINNEIDSLIYSHLKWIQQSHDSSNVGRLAPWVNLTLTQVHIHKEGSHT